MRSPEQLFMKLVVKNTKRHMRAPTLKLSSEFEWLSPTVTVAKLASGHPQASYNAFLFVGIPKPQHFQVKSSPDKRNKKTRQVTDIISGLSKNHHLVTVVVTISMHLLLHAELMWCVQLLQIWKAKELMANRGWKNHMLISVWLSFTSGLRACREPYKGLSVILTITAVFTQIADKHI